MKWLSSRIFLVVLITTANAAPTTRADVDDPSRLPTSSIPISYDLTLTTNVHDGTRAFNGTVKIEIEIKEATDVITLHNSGLTVQSLKLFNSTDEEILTSLTEETDYDFIRIQSTSRSLQAGEIFTVEASFTGELSTGTSGFYRSSYSIENETR